ncbi:hypothetical protein PR048_005851 [Dryococelus australis]|uniref:DDE Tnp4 domain-containing protein n=1 Tax=Dryococelus australis TaxID=614101 RepID=A0ABQ9IAJ8_9NEOP|nr:hypothetical protein PR048_005851 [Dryococelus australis]
MRITPKQFVELLTLVSPIIQRSDTVMCEVLPARLKLETALTYLVSGTIFIVIMSKSAISAIIPEVCEAIKDVLKDYIKKADLCYQKGGGGMILGGDDAFPLKPCLLKPYSGKSLTTQQKTFVYRQRRVCRIAENAFGILCSCFRVYGKPIIVHVDRAIKIVQAACALHNYLRLTSPNTNTPPGSLDYENTMTGSVLPPCGRLRFLVCVVYFAQEVTTERKNCRKVARILQGLFLRKRRSAQARKHDTLTAFNIMRVNVLLCANLCTQHTDSVHVFPPTGRVVNGIPAARTVRLHASSTVSRRGGGRPVRSKNKILCSSSPSQQLACKFQLAHESNSRGLFRPGAHVRTMSARRRCGAAKAFHEGLAYMYHCTRSCGAAAFYVRTCALDLTGGK